MQTCVFAVHFEWRLEPPYTYQLHGISFCTTCVWVRAFFFLPILIPFVAMAIYHLGSVHLPSKIPDRKQEIICQQTGSTVCPPVISFFLWPVQFVCASACAGIHWRHTHIHTFSKSINWCTQTCANICHPLWHRFIPHGVCVWVRVCMCLKATTKEQQERAISTTPLLTLYKHTLTHTG